MPIFKDDSIIQTTWANRGDAADNAGREAFFTDSELRAFSNGNYWITEKKRQTNRLFAALRKLELGDNPSRWLLQGDSTGDETTEWFYLTALAVAAKYPAFTCKYRLFNGTSQQYDDPVTLNTGTAGLKHVLTGSSTTSWQMRIADSATTSPVGDFDVRIKLCFNGTMLSAAASLCGKYNVSGNQRCWRLRCGADGIPTFSWSADGIAVTTKAATAALTGSFLTDVFWLRATIDVDNGAAGNDIKFYTSIDDGVTWVQLGATVTTAGVASIFDGTSNTQFIGVGTGYLEQQDHDISFYEMETYNSLDGTSRTVDIDVGEAVQHTTGTTTNTFLDDLGNTVTLFFNDTGSMPGAPRLLISNGSVGGQAISYGYDVTRYPKMVCGNADVAFISYSHNDGVNINYRPEYKTLTDKHLVTNPDMCIIGLSQNRRKAPAGGIEAHKIRCQQIGEFTASQGFDFIDAYSELTDADTSDIDGVHPNASGSINWGNIVKRYLNVSA